MLQPLFSIHTSDAQLALRGRLLKVAAIIIAVATLAFVPITLSGGSIINSMLMVPLSALIFAMAHYGRVREGSLLLVAAAFASLVFGAPPEAIMSTSAGTAFFIPILLAALVLGANAVLIATALSIVSIIGLGLYTGIPLNILSWVNIVLLLVSGGLTWLIIRVLERSLRESQRQADEARRAQEELQSREQALISANAELKSSNEQMEALLNLVRELEIPVIPLLEGVLVAPLVGHLDTRRVDQINRAVLEAVYEQRARIVIIDITGISVVDTAVAQRIEHLAQSIQLLGARVLLTGIKADVAQTITDLNLNFSAIQTAGRLQDGVAAVLADMSRQN